MLARNAARPTLIAAAGVLALSLSACGGASPGPPAASSGSGSESASASSAEGATGGRGSAVSEERCAANEAAGPITSVTGYQFQSSASVLDVVAADGLGYFDALCLDVTVQPGTGDASANAQLVAAGTAQVADLGGQADLLRAADNGIDVRGVATLGHVPIATLMTLPDVTDLTQLDGTTLGHKGQLPPPISGMLDAAGVDVESLRQVTVGFDPSVLPRGQVDSLTAYRSNEPNTLRAAGTEVTTWDPQDYGIPGSFGTTIVNPAFAAEHPTAVEDFLRAALHALDTCAEQAQTCVEIAADRAGAGYDVDHNEKIWATEHEIVVDSTPDGQQVGEITAREMTTEAQALVDGGALSALPDVDAIIDTTVVPGLYDDGDLVWPAR